MIRHNLYESIIFDIKKKKNRKQISVDEINKYFNKSL